MMLYNNQNKYTSALLVPNGEALARWANSHHIDLTGSKGLEAVLNEIESVINQYKQGGVNDDMFPSRWLPSTLAILDEPFNMDNKLLNSTGKMVRTKIIAYHKDKISFLYTPEAKSIVNTLNIETIRKIFKNL
jgi:long-chain acyl-CoA synthetase